MSEDITVISQSTAEREKETIELFNKIKPYLDEGLTYTQSVKKVLGFHGSPSFSARAWFKNLINYGETQGYPYSVYSGKGKVKRRDPCFMYKKLDLNEELLALSKYTIVAFTGRYTERIIEVMVKKDKGEKETRTYYFPNSYEYGKFNHKLRELYYGET